MFSGDALVTIGHDTPVHRSAIESLIGRSGGGATDQPATKTTDRAREIHAASADAKTYSESLKAAFPDRQLASVADFSARLLYAARR